MLLLILLVWTFMIDMLTHALVRSYVGAGNICACVSMAAYLVAAVVSLQTNMHLFSILFVVFIAYRVMNMARVLKGRMHRQYLARVTYKTTLRLTALQLLVLALWRLWLAMGTPWHGALMAALLMECIGGCMFLLVVRGHAKRMRQVATPELVQTADLPALTIAIPARNETSDLYDCIQSLLASQYPKLEIVVLDDCSQTRRTPEIIRGFAHDGVRFINGEVPSPSWLPKNQAYERLAESANGEYIIFAGVDIRFDPMALKRLVSYAVLQRKDMVCVMPENALPARALPLIQPMRYAWELVWPRKLANKPPVLSSCWLVRASALQQAGGFKAAARMVVPEAYLARQFSKDNCYSFVAGGTVLGISSVKNMAEQRETAIRVGYPSTHRRPEVVSLVTLGYIAWITIPLLGVIQTLLHPTLLQAMLLLIIFFLHMLMYATILKLAYGKAPLGVQLSLPFAALMYVGLLNYSMCKYEFSEVIWKGRNVCLPVMHVVPHLPPA